MNLAFDNYIIRLLHRDDLAAYYNLIDRNRPRLEDFFAGTVAITRTIEDTATHLEDVVSKAEHNQYFPLVVVERTSTELIASIQIKSIDWSIPKGELGYYIDAAWEGKGIVTKAVGLITDYAFEHLKFNKLFIRTHHGNKSSRLVAEKNGFTVEGTLKADYKTTAGKIIDTMYYARLRPGIEY